MNLAGFPGAVVLLFLISVYGWGRVGRRFCDGRILRIHSLSAVLGLALLNFIGGLLNLFQLATAPVLFTLMLAGLMMAGVDLLRTRPWRGAVSSARIAGDTTGQRWPRTGRSAVPLVLALIAGGGACLTLTPTTLFNAGDDFHTYVPRAVRMVQTGSVGGNPFDASGLDSLGSQSFFHGFFLMGSDISSLNGFDAIACFALLLLLVAEVSLRWRLPWYVGTLGVICVLAINPQYVNISPLYSGALLVAGLLVTSALLAKGLEAESAKLVLRSGIAMALIASALVTLKLTLAFFAFFYLLCFWVVLWGRQSGHRAGVLKHAVVTACLCGLFIFPWALVHLPTLLRAKQLGVVFGRGAAIPAKYPSMAAHDIAGLFSFRPLFYGNNPAAFHLLVVICLLFALAGLWVWLFHSDRKRGIGLSSVIAAGLSVPAVYLLNADLFNAESGIRYSCPVLIGAVGVGFVCCLRFGRDSVSRAQYQRGILLSSILLGGVILTFATNFAIRAGRSVENRSLLSFQLTQPYIDLVRHMVSETEANYTRTIQTRMEPGAGTLVWIVAPFHLSFLRNRLYLVSEGGLTSPALHFPAGAPVESLNNYLREWGIRYVLIETKGGAVREESDLKELLKSEFASYRKLGDYAIYFRQSLMALAERSRFRHFDGRMLLFELEPSGKE